MNHQIISKYLQQLRKANNMTQEALANELNISRQAVSNWETGNTLPDLDALLQLSKLYGVTINDLLEPQIPQKYLSSFEQLTEIAPDSIKLALADIPTEEIIKASMGASPRVNDYLASIFTYLDFPEQQNLIGRIKIEEIEAAQNEIVKLINLL